MDDDYYQFVEKQMALVGGRTHKMYRIGQAVRVHLENVDVEQRNIDFKLVPDESTPKADFDTSDLLQDAPVKKSFGGPRGGNRNGGPHGGNGNDRRNGGNRNGQGGGRNNRNNSLDALANKWGAKGNSANRGNASHGPRNNQFKNKRK
jgi:ribonuclease R